MAEVKKGQRGCPRLPFSTHLPSQHHRPSSTQAASRSPSSAVEPLEDEFAVGTTRGAPHLVDPGLPVEHETLCRRSELPGKRHTEGRALILRAGELAIEHLPSDCLDGASEVFHLLTPHGRTTRRIGKTDPYGGAGAGTHH